MQSVTSNAVYKKLNTIETYTDISGLVLYKIGLICYGTLEKSVTGNNGYTIGTLPVGLRPKVGCRVCLIDNSTDTPTGQLFVYTNGSIRLWKSGGGNFSGTACVGSFCYIIN